MSCIYTLQKGLFFFDVKSETARVLVNTVDIIKSKIQLSSTLMSLKLGQFRKL